MVPTVERGLRLVVFCSMEIDGAQAVNGVDVGALHLVEKLPGIGGERLDVAPLALGVNRVERERGFAGAAQARDRPSKCCAGSRRQYSSGCAGVRRAPKYG